MIAIYGEKTSMPLLKEFWVPKGPKRLIKGPGPDRMFSVFPKIMSFPKSYGMFRFSEQIEVTVDLFDKKICNKERRLELLARKQTTKHIYDLVCPCRSV